ncbi:MAG TPA: hypothetical protein DCE56_23435 [Cyanobacteria bacterium UBA8553]|nr:hypothetical protein [Cyanobacteria bacterium UBA8553]
MLKPAKSLPIATLILVLGGLIAKAAMSSAQASSAVPTITKATQANPLQDTLVIPGERVGTVTRSTTRQDLVKQFGKARLSDQSVHIGEGSTQPGTRVDLDQERSFTVIWSDNTRTKPVEVRNLGSAWQTPQGIRVGTPLNQLQQKLGTFQFFGFAWDYGGTVALEGTKLAQYQKTLVLRLATAPNAPQRAPNDYHAVIGDRKFSSTNPRLKSLGVKVGEMIVRLTPTQR